MKPDQSRKGMADSVAVAVAAVAEEALEGAVVEAANGVNPAGSATIFLRIG
jgi:hypothetical protein